MQHSFFLSVLAFSDWKPAKNFSMVLLLRYYSAVTPFLLRSICAIHIKFSTDSARMQMTFRAVGVFAPDCGAGEGREMVTPENAALRGRPAVRSFGKG